MTVWGCFLGVTMTSGAVWMRPSRSFTVLLLFSTLLLVLLLLTLLALLLLLGQVCVRVVYHQLSCLQLPSGGGAVISHAFSIVTFHLHFLPHHRQRIPTLPM